MLDWTLDLIFSKDLVQFETTRSRAERRATSPVPRTDATHAEGART